MALGLAALLGLAVSGCQQTRPAGRERGPESQPVARSAADPATPAAVPSLAREDRPRPETQVEPGHETGQAGGVLSLPTGFKVRGSRFQTASGAPDRTVRTLRILSELQRAARAPLSPASPPPPPAAGTARLPVDRSRITPH